MASKRRIRRKQCGKKRRHATRDNAVIEMVRSRVSSGLHPYRCEFCGMWHVGGKRPKGWIEKR